MTQNPNPYSRWLKALDDFIEYSISPCDYNEAQEDAICNLIRETYIDIFRKIISGSPGKDQWKYINALPLDVPTGYAVNHYSDRYETEFSFGSDEKGFFLQIMLNYPEHLRDMDDTFWLTMLELQHLGTVEFEQNRYMPESSSEATRMLTGSKSQVFNLLRNSFFLEAIKDDTGDFGYLTVRWPLSIRFENLVENGNLVFKKLLSLNLALLEKQGSLA